MKARHYTTPEERADILRSYLRGASTTALSTRYGMSQTGISKIVRQAGVSRPRGAYKIGG